MLLLITDSTSVMDANGVGIVVVIGAWVVVGGRDLDDSTTAFITLDPTATIAILLIKISWQHRNRNDNLGCLLFKLS